MLLDKNHRTKSKPFELAFSLNLTFGVPLLTNYMHDHDRSLLLINHKDQV